MLMRRHHAQLLVIDVQTNLAPHVHEGEKVVERCGRLIAVARRLGVPVTITEHYPKGLGGTVQAVKDKAGNDTPVLTKIEFSGLRNPGIRERVEGLRRSGRADVVVAGMEAHVCVGQTAHDLLAAGFRLFLVADAVGSRETAARDLSIRRIEQAGGAIVHHEMVAFEWLQRGDAPEFKDVLGIVK